MHRFPFTAKSGLIASRSPRRQGYSPEGHGKRVESRKKEESREKLKAPKCLPESSKTSPREPKTAQNGAKSAPRRPQEEPKRDKKANPNRETKKESNQDDPKTVLDRPRAD